MNINSANSLSSFCADVVLTDGDNEIVAGASDGTLVSIFVCDSQLD